MNTVYSADSLEELKVKLKDDKEVNALKAVQKTVLKSKAELCLQVFTTEDSKIVVVMPPVSDKYYCFIRKLKSKVA